MADDGSFDGSAGHGTHRVADPDAAFGADSQSWECDERRGGPAYAPVCCTANRDANRDAHFGAHCDAKPGGDGHWQMLNLS